MTERIKNLLELLKSEKYKEKRYSKVVEMDEKSKSASEYVKSSLLLEKALENETPNLFLNDRIGFNRSNTEYCTILDENGEILNRFWLEGNNVLDYETTLNCGLDAKLEEIKEQIILAEGESREFLESAYSALNSALKFADKYRDFAKENGNDELYKTLCQVPHKKATTLLEACVFLKFIIFTLRCNKYAHVTLGRFDKYMRPFYKSDLKTGKSREELRETIEEFFISINFDTDLYIGVQKGDNGQSMVLGGMGSFDDFSHICMEASLELNLIDPKINLRVDKNTPDELYEFATLLTKQGMGFPQYCNDDVVIEGLKKLGYDGCDAEDYAVAACWEFITSGNGRDIPNIALMNFPKVINFAVENYLENCNSFEEFLEKVRESVKAESNFLMESLKGRKSYVCPYLSIFVKDCIKRRKDITKGGAKYFNYGIHGAGIATAADSLLAIKTVVFDEKEFTASQLIDALNLDFEGYGELRNRLLSCKKMGNNEREVDELAYLLMDTFAKNVNGKPNDKGGIFRAGTGSAQGYVYDASQITATPDGRHAFAPFGSSFSPSLEAGLGGPISCIKSFTGYDLENIINGGPLTLEIHDTVFRNEDGIKKVAQLVKAFIHLGGHQLQLNSINREVLLDAMEHPENHKNLIVRVWGWSGYFNELDVEFKKHIINRTEFII